MGIYSYHFSTSFDKVIAYEPISDITYRIDALKRKNITIHNVALSNKKDMLGFFIPLRDGKLVPSLASLEARDPPYKVCNVEVNTLDCYHYSDVDLIKIDVEGHEVAVIEGAKETIARCKPLLIIEIEQRHISIPIENVFDLICKQGYSGYFLKNRNLIPIAKFSYAINQKPYLTNEMHDLYVNNFIFIPDKH